MDELNYFAQPVPRNTVGYHEIIADPMDFATIKKNITKAHQPYSGPCGLQAFFADIQLIVDNCQMFNVEGSDVYESATALESQLNAMKQAATQRWLAETAVDSSHTSSTTTLTISALASK